VPQRAASGVSDVTLGFVVECSPLNPCAGVAVRGPVQLSSKLPHPGLPLHTETGKGRDPPKAIKDTLQVIYMEGGNECDWEQS